MPQSSNRRTLLKGVAALGAASAGGIAFAQGKAVSATTDPGAWESAHRGILLPAFAQAHRVLSAVLDEGRNNRVRVFVAPGRVPPTGFARSTGTLEDAYLVLMRCPSNEIPPALVHSAAPALAGGAA
jgi:hypothetical protein